MAASITSSNGLNFSSSTSVTKTFSYTSDGNPLLVVIGLGNLNSVVQTVTFNGVALQKIGRKNGGSYAFDAWQLQSPGVATANIVVTWTTASTAVFGAFNVSGSAVGLLTADNIFYASATSTAPSVTATSRTGDLVLGLVWGGSAVSQTFTSGGSQSRIFTNTGASTNPKFAADTKAGAASDTLTFTLGTSAAWGFLAVNLNDVVGTPSTVRASQDLAEIFGSGKQEARISQLIQEIFGSGKFEIRGGQLVIEVFTPNQVSPVRISQLAQEIFGQGSDGIQVSQIVMEIFTPNINTPASQFPALLLVAF